MEMAIETLLSRAAPPADVETLPLQEGLGRVLARELLASLDVPPADNSAMDGFALNSTDALTCGGVSLPISQRIPAGRAPLPLKPGTAARIFTGAEIPPGADTVVIQEDCRWDDTHVRLPDRIETGANIRPRGQDLAAGSPLLPRGHRLRPQDLGLLASVGIADIPVYRRLKVAFFSTGDELVEPGNPLAPGQIYNSNRYTLGALLSSLGCQLLDLGIVSDDATATEKALKAAAENADCILTSGGVSVGEEDHVKSAVERLGQLDLWKLAIKPGKPLAFGRVLDKPIIGLPGNPASVFVTFAIVARPFLLKMQGRTEPTALQLSVRADFSRPNPAKRQEYLRARLEVDESGCPWARLTGNQSSGVLSTASRGNGFAVHCLGRSVSRGDELPFLLFSELFG